MPKLVQKSSYIAPARASGYMKYIATREGVELLPCEGPASEGQKKLVASLLRDCPDAAELFEYADYLRSPTAENASVFLTQALDANPDTASRKAIYLRYIAERPRAEKHGGHGLFGAEDSVDLSAALSGLSKYEGRVWTIIFSLRREDASRLGYDCAAAWRNLLCAYQTDLAEAMKIPFEQFRWYAAFHNESHHPHIHMMVWSDDPAHGYLTPSGITTMRSVLTNEIFRDELTQLYRQKDISYRELTAAAHEAMGETIARMRTGVCDAPRIAELMPQLAAALDGLQGKKQYGYLPKGTKLLVDEIINELARQSDVAACYETWNTLRDELQRVYTDEPRERLPLSAQKEFRAVKNIVVSEAERMRLGAPSFEDEGADEKQDGYARYCLGRDALLAGERESARLCFKSAAEQGNPYAQYALGKLCLEDGDRENANRCFAHAAEGGHPCAQFLLDHIDGGTPPDALLAGSRLLNALAQVFRDNSVPPANPGGIRADSRRRKKLQNRRIAIGHRPDDREDYIDPKLNM